MGLYDYINKDGDQIKCFYVPCITIQENKETGEKEVSFYASGGALRSFVKAPVPFMTPYYNYGETFAIMEYRLLPKEYEAMVHIVRNGYYVESFNIDNLPDNYNLPKHVIDKYGQWYNIDSAIDMKFFIAEHALTTEQAEQETKDELAKVGLKTQLPAFDKTRPVEDYVKEFKIREEIDTKIHETIYKPLLKKWWNYSHESKLEIIGFILADYEDVKNKPTERVQRTEDDWRLIFSQAIEYLKKENYPTPLNNYFQWCEKEGIIIDRHKAAELFAKYAESE